MDFRGRVWTKCDERVLSTKTQKVRKPGSETKRENVDRFVSHSLLSVTVSCPLPVHVHLDPSNSFAAAAVDIRSVHASNSISYTTNVMPLTGNARAHISQKPRKNRAAPPSRYVLIAQSHVPRYAGSAARPSTITFDLTTSNGNTDIQLAIPARHESDERGFRSRRNRWPAIGHETGTSGRKKPEIFI